MPEHRRPKDIQPTTQCTLCLREMPLGTWNRHHLVPRSRKKNQVTTPFCQCCHKMVHSTYTNATLERRLASLDALRAAPELQKYLTWVRKQPPEVMYRCKDRKHKL